MYISAFTIGMGYLIGGLVPLMPYFFIEKATTALIYSSVSNAYLSDSRTLSEVWLTCVFLLIQVVTGIVLLVFGGIKQHFTGAAGGFTGYLRGAVSTLCVGGAAAGGAFAIVRALESSNKVQY